MRGGTQGVGRNTYDGPTPTPNRTAIFSWLAPPTVAQRLKALLHER